MRNFEATLKGYQTQTPEYYAHINPDDYNIPSENHEAFKLGAKLRSGRFMVISCDSFFEFKRDVANFNNVVDEVNAYYGKELINHYDIGAVKDDNEFSILDPDTGERFWPHEKA